MNRWRLHSVFASPGITMTTSRGGSALQSAQASPYAASSAINVAPHTWQI
jgi:hypothetical protein